MAMGKIRIKTLTKALEVCYGSIDKNRILNIDEIIQAIHGERANAYNHQRFLRKLFPAGPLDENRPVGDEQRRLI